MPHIQARDRGGARPGSDGTGRLLVAQSGTEPLIRVMAEGEDEALIAGSSSELVRHARRRRAPRRARPNDAAAC